MFCRFQTLLTLCSFGHRSSVKDLFLHIGLSSDEMYEATKVEGTKYEL